MKKCIVCETEVKNRVGKCPVCGSKLRRKNKVKKQFRKNKI